MYGYEGIHAEYYDLTSEGLEGDVDFYVEEARAAGSPVLELGTGTGRILFPVAQAGVEITGLDLSPSMLGVARRKLEREAPEVRERITLVEGDMINFSLGGRFKLVIIPYRAFLHLLTVEEQRACLACVRDHLDEGGRLVFNIFDPRLEIIAAYRTPLGGSLGKMGDFTQPDTGRRIVVWEARDYDTVRQVVTVDRVFEELDEQGRSTSRSYSTFTLRWLYRYEAEHLLALEGFKVDALWGDFKRGPFRYGNEQIWAASRA